MLTGSQTTGPTQNKRYPDFSFLMETFEASEAQIRASIFNVAGTTVISHKSNQGVLQLIQLPQFRYNGADAGIKRGNHCRITRIGMSCTCL